MANGDNNATANGAKGGSSDEKAHVSITTGLLPDKFDGKNFKQWQERMHFFLHNLALTKYLTEDPPVVPEGNTDPTTLATVEAWKHSDYLCKGHIKNRLMDELFDVYNEVKTSKELWEALEKEYKSYNVGSGKFAVAKLLNFEMVDDKPIMEQVHQLQLLFTEIKSEGMKLCEVFTVNCFVEKLPPSWEDFKNYLAYKQKALSLANLISRLQNESLKRDKGDKDGQVKTHDANVAEYKKKGKGKPLNNKAAPNKFPPRNPTNFKKQAQPPMNNKFNGKCNYCGKFGHKSSECRRKAKSENQAHLAEADLCAVVTEANLVEENPKAWWYDTGATTHICTDRDMFSTYQKCKTDEQLKMGNVSQSKIEGTGKVVLKMTSGMEITLNNVKHVPDMRKNLISGTLMSKHGFAINFESDQLIVRKNGIFIGKGYVTSGLIKMSVMTVLKKNNVVPVSKVSMNKNQVAYVVESSNIWHERLGHVNYKSIQRLMNLNMIPKSKISKDKCEICVQAKLTKMPSPHVERTTEPLGLIHTDLCDLKYVQSRGGKKYFVTFIDDCTRYCYVYLLRSKDEVLDKFKEYKLEVEKQLEKTIKIVRSDRGGEYDGPFNAFCQANDIIHQTTAPYSPESNGVAERKNRTLKEMMNAMLQESGLPQNLWGEALLTTNYILNKIPHKVTGKTPYELWKGNVPSYKYLKVWGCLAKVAVPPPKKVTVGPKTVDCIFIGYAHNSSAYRFLVHKSDVSDIHVNTIMESRNASFFEHIFPCKDKQAPKRTREERDAVTSVNEIEEEHVEDEPRRSKRARKEKSFGEDFMMVFLIENEPKSYTEAMSTPDAPY